MAHESLSIQQGFLPSPHPWGHGLHAISNSPCGLWRKPHYRGHPHRQHMDRRPFLAPFYGAGFSNGRARHPCALACWPPHIPVRFARPTVVFPAGSSHGSFYRGQGYLPALSYPDISSLLENLSPMEFRTGRFRGRYLALRHTMELRSRHYCGGLHRPHAGWHGAPPPMARSPPFHRVHAACRDLVGPDADLRHLHGKQS